MRNVLYFIACTLLFIACKTKPVSVIIDKKFTGENNEKHLIIFDGKDSVKLADSTVTVQLQPGKHSFVLDKEPAKEVTISEAGGLLNLSNQEYVVFEIEYGEMNNADPDKININMNRVSFKASILIDSFVITPKGISSASISDSSRRQMLTALMASKNGNYFHMGSSDYDNNYQVHGLKKFGKDKLFIDKFWDYGFNDEIPKTVEVYVQKNSFTENTTVKTGIIHADLFLLAAQMSPDEYIIQSVADIRSGKKVPLTINKDEEDKQDDDAKDMKEVQKNKEKKQMKF